MQLAFSHQIQLNVTYWTFLIRLKKKTFSHFQKCSILATVLQTPSALISFARALVQKSVILSRARGPSHQKSVQTTVFFVFALPNPHIKVPTTIRNIVFKTTVSGTFQAQALLNLEFLIVLNSCFESVTLMWTAEACSFEFLWQYKAKAKQTLSRAIRLSKARYGPMRKFKVFFVLF